MWKKLLKVLALGALGGVLNAGATATTDNSTVNTVVTAIAVAVAGAISTDDKKKKE